MKKVLILIFMVLFVALFAKADYLDVLNGINRTINTIEYTESTINRIQNTVPDTNNTNQNSYRNRNRNQTVRTNPNTSYPSYSSYPNNYNNQNVNYSNTNKDVEFSVKQQEQQVQYGTNNFDQNRNYTGDAKTLKELPAGTIVMDVNSVWNYRLFMNYTGEISASYPVFWKKLEDNHYTKDATLLLSVPTVAHYPFCHRNKGLRAWDESDVRRFLRTTFYNHLSAGFKNAIVEVDIPFADMEGKPKTVRDNFFLLSVVEWVLSDRANNGTAIKYNDLPNMYGALSIISYDKNNNTYYMNNNFERNWTRTINKPTATGAGYNNEVFVISDKGVLETEQSWYDSVVVRPAVNLKSSTKVKGPYKFDYNFGMKSIVYYVLDFTD